MSSDNSPVSLELRMKAHILSEKESDSKIKDTLIKIYTNDWSGHAYYSATQSECTKGMIRYDGKGQIRKNIRHNVYLDYDGNEVLTTEISSNPPEEYDHLNRFGDSTYVGPVAKWVKTVYW